MNDDFNIPYLNSWSGGLLRKKLDMPFVLPRINLNTDEDSEKDDWSALISRHFPLTPALPPIVIRQTRHIDIGNMPNVMPQIIRKRIAVRDIAVNAVHPYARKSQANSYWQDKDWEKRGNALIGFYSACDDMYAGSIELTDSVVQPARFFIYNPPDAVIDGPHSGCFRFRGKTSGKDKYWIHFSEEPTDIDSGIITVEQTIADSIRSR